MAVVGERRDEMEKADGDGEGGSSGCLRDEER